MPNTVKESSVRRTAAPPSPTPPPAAPQPVRPRLPPAGVQLSTLAWQLAAGCAGILLGAGQIYGGAAPFGLALAIGCAPGYLPAASLGAIVGSLAFLPLAQAGPLSLAVLAVLAARRLRPGRRWMSAGAGCAVLLVTGIGTVFPALPSLALLAQLACTALLAAGFGQAIHSFPHRQAPGCLSVAGPAGRLCPAADLVLVCPRPGTVCPGRAVHRLCRQPGTERRAGGGDGRRGDGRQP